MKVTNEAPFYVDYLRRELDQNYPRSLGKDGLRIFTGLDLRLQKIAEKALSEGLAKLEASHPALKKKSAEEGLEGAIVGDSAADRRNQSDGRRRNYQKSQFNRIFQAKRQAGSVFKPFVFLAAFMHGGQSGMQYFPDTVVNDSLFNWSMMAGSRGSRIIQ